MKIKQLLALFAGLMSILSFSLMIQPTSAQSFGANWLGEYFNNPSLTGSPVLSNIDAAINFNWGLNSPNAAFLPVDNFSVRWSGVQTIIGGVYQFTATGDNGIRLTIDGTIFIDQFGRTGEVASFQATATLVGDQHLVVLEYIHRAGSAAVQLQWVPLTVGTTGTPGPTGTPLPTMLPPIPPGAITATVIRATVLNTRSAPSLGAPVVDRILRGQTYSIVGRDSDARWFLLQLSNKQAWAYGYYLFINGNEFNPPVTSSIAVFGLPPGVIDTGVLAQARSTLRLRAAPTTAADQTGRITWGGFVPVVGRTSDGIWYQVVWKGTLGWAYSSFLKITEGDLVNVPIVR